MKNKDIKIINPNNDEVFNQDSYFIRVERLERKLKRNQEAIKKLNKESTEAKIHNVDDDFYINLMELSNLKEMQNDIKGSVAQSKIGRLDNLYNEIQNNYLNKKIEIIDEKMSIVNKDMNDAIEHVKENTNNITGNILFSLISIVLGISLVSAMTTAIKDMDAKYYLPYYVTMGWLAILVIGFSYLLLRNYDRKAKAIVVVLACATLVLMAVFYCSFFK